MEGSSPLFFVALLPALWFAVTYLIAALGGWRALAERYRASDGGVSGSAQGIAFRMQSARLGRWAGYNNVLTFTASPAGLRMAVFFLFRFGHPPLFVPWTEIRVERGKSWFVRVATLHFARSPVRVHITPRLAGRLSDASGGALALPAGAP